MRPEFRDRRNPIKRLWDSTVYAFEGFTYAYRYESSFSIHIVFVIISLLAAFFFKITLAQWLIIIGLNLLIILVELINTAIEATVDLVTSKIHPLAKIAKDCACAATFVIAATTAISEFIIFLPYVIQFIGGIVK